jgi:hypothetical protein
MAYGNTRTCSASCKYKQMKITQEEGARRRRERMRKGKSTLVEIQQKAREAGMSYGMYMAVTKGGMAIERGEADEDSMQKGLS